MPRRKVESVITHPFLRKSDDDPHDSVNLGRPPPRHGKVVRGPLDIARARNSSARDDSDERRGARENTVKVHA